MAARSGLHFAKNKKQVFAVNFSQEIMLTGSEKNLRYAFIADVQRG